jgi:hypothetical protein
MISQNLRGPKRKEVIALLKNVAEDDKNNPSVYKIQLMKFDPKDYYDSLLTDIDGNIVPDRLGGV